MHAELCLLEAFEVEASHMLADMPQLDSDPPESETRRLKGSRTEESVQVVSSFQSRFCIIRRHICLNPDSLGGLESPASLPLCLRPIGLAALVV